MAVKIVKRLFMDYTGEIPGEVMEFPSSGSSRRYFRLKSRHYGLVGVWGDSSEENEAFKYMSAHFKERGLPVPEVYASSDDGLAYLQEDLGDTLLFDLMAEGRNTGVWSEEVCDLLKKTVRLLPVVQFKGAEGMDFARCYPLAAFNRRGVFWDLNYFKYCFLKTAGIDFREDLLEDDFGRLADLLLQNTSDTFMYRDFQSRNVMVRDGEPWLIDYQGGRKGPVYYDVASFLWQARAKFSEALREMLLKEYLEELSRYTSVDETEFRKQLRYFVLFRLLQVLGAYGFRGYFEKKSHFLQSIPAAIVNLRDWLRGGFDECPYLASVLFRLVDSDRYQVVPPKDQLEVSVYSFAYPKGIPEDTSGNGGGFVFDCRAIHNPGKYEPYKALTGMDEPVIRFLEEDGEITVFLSHVYALVDASVERYLKRGFTSLTVSFGCTGGQHRSVYSAQHLAEHLYSKYGVRVRLVHRERHIETIYQ